VEGAIVHAVWSGGDSDGETGSVVGSNGAHDVLVGVGGCVVGFVNNQALWLESFKAKGLFSAEGLNRTNEDLWSIRLLFIFDSNPELRVLEGDSGRGLLKQLAAVGENQPLVGFLLAELTDESTEQRGFSGAGRHDDEDAVQPLVFAS
jgi:hypothetical protein